MITLARVSAPKTFMMPLITRYQSTYNNVFAMVMGGGVVGSSVAYHLTKRNIKEVILIERDRAATPAGTTHSSPGFVIAAHPSHRYKPFLAYSVNLYAKLEKETGQSPRFEQNGTLHLANNPHRYEEFKRYVARDYYKKGDTCRTSLLTPEETAELAPLVDAKQILGALYTSNDGVVSARGLNEALIVGAKKGGVRVIKSEPTTIRYDKGKSLWYVELADGTSVTTRNLVNAAGVWANDVARLSSHELPMVIVEVQFADLEPNAPIPDMPAIIDHDTTFYLRKNGVTYFFGAFDPFDKVVIREDWFRKGVPPGTSSTLREEDKICLQLRLVSNCIADPSDGSRVVKPDFSRIEKAYERVLKVVPSIQEAKIVPKAAIMCMTPDGYSLAGPFDKNYWVAAGFMDGITCGGGIGKYLADWIVDGEPTLELYDTDASRYERWATREFILEKSKETYSMFCNWSDSDRLAGRPTDRISGVYGRLKRDKGHFSFRNGWEVPEIFDIEEEGMLSTLSREYQMVTNKCGVIDMSWEGKIEVKGKDAEALLNYACCSKIPPPGKIATGLMLTKQGRVLGPLKIFHHDNTRSAFLMLTEPERESRDIYWLRRSAAEKKFDVEVNCVSEYLASFALVGPNSRELLSKLTKSDVTEEGFPQRSTGHMRLGTISVVCVRSSTSTGRLSYQLFHDRADSAKLYQEILDVGAQYGVANFGQATWNIMRLEHGYKLWGRELTLDTNPYECGLEALVDLSKEDFIGRTAVLEQGKKKYDRRLALLTFDPSDSPDVPMEWRNLPCGDEVVRRLGHEEKIGQVTSGSYSVRLRKPIAFAWIGSSVRSDEKMTRHRCEGGDDEKFVSSDAFRRSRCQFKFNLDRICEKYAGLESSGKCSGIEVDLAENEIYAPIGMPDSQVYKQVEKFHAFEDQFTFSKLSAPYNGVEVFGKQFRKRRRECALLDKKFQEVFKSKYPLWRPYAEPKKSRVEKTIVKETVKELTFENSLDYLNYVMKLNPALENLFQQQENVDFVHHLALSSNRLECNSENDPNRNTSKIRSIGPRMMRSRSASPVVSTERATNSAIDLSRQASLMLLRVDCTASREGSPVHVNTKNAFLDCSDSQSLFNGAPQSPSWSKRSSAKQDENLRQPLVTERDHIAFFAPQDFGRSKSCAFNTQHASPALKAINAPKKHSTNLTVNKSARTTFKGDGKRRNVKTLNVAQRKPSRLGGSRSCVGRTRNIAKQAATKRTIKKTECAPKKSKGTKTVLTKSSKKQCSNSRKRDSDLLQSFSQRLSPSSSLCSSGRELKSGESGKRRHDETFFERTVTPISVDVAESGIWNENVQSIVSSYDDTVKDSGKLATILGFDVDDIRRQCKDRRRTALSAFVNCARKFQMSHVESCSVDTAMKEDRRVMAAAKNRNRRLNTGYYV